MSDESIIPSVAPEQGPGPLLKSARERAGLSLQDVADGLNLKRKVVEALEQERYDQLPPRTFVKGYFKSYAKLVGVKEYDVLAAFDRSSPVPPPAPLPASARGGDSDGFGWLKWLLLLAAIGAVLAFFYYQGFDKRDAPLPPQPSAAAPAIEDAVPSAAPAAESEAVEPEAIEPTAVEPAPSETAAAEAAPAEPAPVRPGPAESALLEPAPAESAAVESAPAEPTPAPAAASTAEPAISQSTAATGTVALTVAGDSWLEVRDGTGESRYAGLAHGPRGYEFSGQPPFSLVIGDISQVELRYNGEPVALQPFARGKVARFSVPTAR